ncbi:unnamed protein product [Acanthocheilonema viteae]|uniref:dihydrofolate reductase n=1 Tax=Acanthocheilonema viteae TaxID=6277 RepID=A0A498S6G6_ACAVI|nr:unnamed protein product [Acanthocheilonema viteae]
MTRTIHMNLIVAVDDCGGIGRNGGLPWNLPAEMARFSKLTTLTRDSRKKNAVIMGRKMEEVTDENIIVARSFESAVNLLQDMENIETIWNIGGRELYITRVEGDFSADVFFPEVNYDRFIKCEESKEVQEEKSIKYRYETYTVKTDATA